MKKRFTEEQIIGFLRESDAALKINNLCFPVTRLVFTSLESNDYFVAMSSRACNSALSSIAAVRRAFVEACLRL
jgi:hypothetical protein